MARTKAKHVMFLEKYRWNAVVPALASVMVSLAVQSPASAQVATQIVSASSLSASDSTLTYTGSNSALNSYTGTVSGKTITFTATNGTLALETEESFGGAFAGSTNLLETKLPDGEASGPLTITFSSAVQEFGLSAQDIDADIQTFNFTLMSAAGSLGSFTVGPSDNTHGIGQTVFLGASAPAGFGITRVIISSISLSDETGDSGSNLFAVGPVTFKTLAAAPEPSALLLWILGGAILGMRLLSAQRRGRYVESKG